MNRLSRYQHASILSLMAEGVAQPGAWRLIGTARRGNRPIRRRGPRVYRSARPNSCGTYAALHQM